MLETRIKFSGALEQNLRDYVEYQYANERGAIQFTIKEALIKFLEDKTDDISAKKRSKMISEFPRIMGEAIVGGLTKRKPPKQHIEASYGQSGEVECPDCGQLISVGSKAKNAICANCGLKIPIRRVGKEKEEQK